MISVNELPLKCIHYPDGTIKPELKDIMKHIRELGEDYIEITWAYDNDAELFQLITLKKHLDNNFICNACLKLAFVPNSRMDRTYSCEEAFTLKYFCEVINGLKFDGVRIEDPHSNVAPALLDNVIVEYRFKSVVENSIDKNTVLFFPDNGSASKYTKHYNHPYAYGLKKRDWETGKILGLDIVENGINLKGKDITIVDDISSRGGTFYYSAKALKELGVNEITLCVTHCENSVLEGEMIKSSLIDRIVTTDSIFTGEHEKIEVKRWYRGEQNEEN